MPPSTGIWTSIRIRSKGSPSLRLDRGLAVADDRGGVSQLGEQGDGQAHVDFVVLGDEDAQSARRPVGDRRRLAGRRRRQDGTDGDESAAADAAPGGSAVGATASRRRNARCRLSSRSCFVIGLIM